MLYQKQISKIVEKVINTISDKQYSQLQNIVSHTNVPAVLQEKELLDLGKWIEGQLEMWAEDEERPFVFDKFNSNQLDIDEEGVLFATYRPESHGEELDFWFEFFFDVQEDNSLRAEFQINI